MSEILDKQFTFSKNVQKLLKCILDNGYFFTFGETYRPPETAKLYAEQGRGIGKSLHCQRLAIDINLFTPDKKYCSISEQYKIFGDYWELLNPNNRWGGKWNDGNHFEMKP